MGAKLNAEELKAKELVEKFGKELALECASEVQHNNPHKIVQMNYVDSGGNDTDETYFKMVSNEFFWEAVKREINKIE